MIYLDIIMTNVEDAIDVVGKRDHLAYPIKDVLKQPKVTLWNLYKLKKLLETGYEMLVKEDAKQNVQSDTNNKREDDREKSQNSGSSPSSNGTALGGHKSEGDDQDK